MDIKKLILFLFPIIVFSVSIIYFSLLGAANPLEASFLILGTQVALYYILLLVVLHLKYNKKIIFLILMIFISYNIMFFYNEGMDKVDQNIRNIKNADIFYPNKYYCKKNDDCILSYTDPKEFELCVNNEYYKNARTVKYLSLKKENVTCICQKNRCEKK